MISISYNDKPDIEAYARDIHADGSKILVDRARASILASEYGARMASSTDELSSLLFLLSGGNWSTISKDALITVLTSYCGCNLKSFISETGGTSLDQTKIILPLIDSLQSYVKNPMYPGHRYDDALRILHTYKEYKALKTRSSQILAKLKKMNKSSVESWGPQLGEVNFIYEPCETGRFYTKNDSIQNWPLELCTAITAPKHYFLFWCDFNQIDFRVGYHLYLREPGTDADKIYLAAEDKYKGMYEIICNAAGKQPDFELFTRYRKAYKKAILSAMYNASESSLYNDIKNHELAHELFMYFQNNKKYQFFRESINNLLNFQVDAIVTDYFGAKRSIPIPPLSNNRAVTDTISKCCNTPIQSTSNSIMMLWLEKSLEYFESQGFSRERDIIPYLIRHDECIFLMHESMLSKMYLFKNILAVGIDDWDIITLEPHFGVYYKEPVKQMEEDFEASCLQHATEIDTSRQLIPRKDGYRPVQEVLKAYVYDMQPLIERARVNYETFKPTLTYAVPENPDEWTTEDAIHVLSDIVRENPQQILLRNILEYQSLVILYSRKINKYKLYHNLDAIFDCAEKIGTDKVVLSSCNTDSSTMHRGIMVKMTSGNSDRVRQLFSRFEALGYPEGWVTIE